MKFRAAHIILLLIPICGSLRAAPSRAESEKIGDALFSSPELTESQLSPDGVYMASTGYYKGVKSVYVINLATKVYNVITVNKDEEIGPFFWIDSDHIVYNVSKWGMYSMGLNVHSIRKGRSWKILNPWETRLYFAGMVDPLTNHDGKFVLKATPGGPPDLYLLDVVTGNLTRLAENTGDIVEYIVDPDGKPQNAIANAEGGKVILDWDGSGWTGRAEKLPGFAPRGMLPGGKFMLTEVVNDKGMKGINLLDVTTGRFSGEPRFIDGYDLGTYPIVDNLSGRVIGLRFDRDRPGNFWFDSAVRKVEEVIHRQFPNYVLDYLGYNAASGISYFIASRDSMPPVVIRLENADPSPKLAYEFYPKTIGMEFPATEPVAYPSKDGAREIHGYLTRPMGEGPYPTVVLLHGGPYERDTWGFDPVVQYLALHGYAVLQVNYRGSSGYGYGYSLNGLAEAALLGVDDVIGAIRMVIDKGVANPDKIAVMGEGFGGLISTGVAAREPGLCEAVISVAAPYDLNKQRQKDLDRNVDWLAAKYNNYNEGFFQSVSPISHVDKISSPVLIMHSKDDERVDLDQAKAMEKALEQAGREVDAFYVDWGWHGKPREKDRIKFLETVLSFLDKHL